MSETASFETGLAIGTFLGCLFYLILEYLLERMGLISKRRYSE